MEYRIGETNTVTDFLSRNACVAAISDSDDHFKQEQTNDDDTREIREYVTEGKLPTGIAR